jgi:hypothetical protein
MIDSYRHSQRTRFLHARRDAAGVEKTKKTGEAGFV